MSDDTPSASTAEPTRPPLEVADIVRSHGPAFVARHGAGLSLAQHRATLCIFLSARLAETVQTQLLTAYPPQTPVAIAYRVSWPDEKIIVTTLAELAQEVRRHHLTRTTLFLVGEAIGGRRNRSRLYDRRHGHLFRAREHDETHPVAERHE